MRKSLLIPVFTALLLTSCGNEGVSRESYDAMYAHMVDMWAKSLEGVHYDSVFYGDSRIAGGDFAKRFEEENAVNLGVGGDKVNNLINRIKLVEAVTPKYTFLSIGGNDAISSSFNEDEFKSSFDLLINELSQLETKIVLNTNPSIRSTSSISENDAKNANDKILKTNNYIKEVANNKSLYLIDIALLLNDEEGMLKEEYTTDGVHYNSAAYEIWFDQIDIAFLNIKN